MTNTATTANATANAVVTSFKVHPLGFSAFEKSTIETFFRLAARRAPFWSVTPRVEDATVLLLNAATRQEYEAHAGKMGPSKKAVIVGAADFGTGWPVIPRPLKLTALLTSLGVFVAGDGAVSTAVTAAPPDAQPTASHPPAPRQNAAQSTMSASGYSSGFVPLHAPEPSAASQSTFGPISSPASILPAATTSAVAPLRAAVPAAAPRPALRPAAPAARPLERRATERAVELSTSTFGSQATQRSHAVSAVIAARKVLIVDDSDVALKFMQSRLRHFGYESQLARSGDEALVMTEKEDYQFVFLDVMMAGLDGYQTCRAIKLNKTKRPTIPVVVMLTSRGGTIDKIRGSMSGCDAYLTKPLNEQQLGMVLAQHAATSIKKAAPADAAARPTGAAPLATYVSRAPSRVAANGRSP
jgi:CheY-like chemotaxis protein